MEHTSESQRGVALLIVLILVTLMSLLAVNMNGLFVSSYQRAEAINAFQTQQWIVNNEEKRLLKQMAQRKSEVFPGQHHWRRTLNLGGTSWQIEGELESAQRCFNLNTLARLPVSAAESGSEPYQRYQAMLAELLALHPARQNGVAIAQNLLQKYAALQETRQPDDKPRVSRLYLENALPAVVRQVMHEDRASPLCLLPSRQARVDINQLTREQAPLLAALFTPDLSVEQAGALIAARPDEGWKTLKDAHEAWMKISYEPSVTLSQFEELLSVRSHFWRSRMTVKSDDYSLSVNSDIYFSPEERLSFIWNHRYVY